MLGRAEIRSDRVRALGSCRVERMLPEQALRELAVGSTCQDRSPCAISVQSAGVGSRWEHAVLS